MNNPINREKLIDYSRKNKPFYRGANFAAHSDMQLLLLKVETEIEVNKITSNTQGKGNTKHVNDAHPNARIDVPNIRDATLNARIDVPNIRDATLNARIDVPNIRNATLNGDIVKKHVLTHNFNDQGNENKLKNKNVL